MNKLEEFIDVVGYEGYLISSLGRVISKQRELPTIYKTRRSRVRPIKERELKLNVGNHGYKTVGLYKNAKPSVVKVHRLVAEAFIPNPDNKPQVNHRNGIKTDNRVENLEWCTASENVRHAFANNLKPLGYGSAHYYSKLTEEKVVEIKKLIKDGIMLKDIAIMFNVSRECISSIKCNRWWKHVKID